MRNSLLSFVFALFSLSAIGQGIVVDSLGVAVNENGASADPSAILDVSSDTRGLLIPRVTNTEMNAIQNPAQGLIVYNTTNSSFYYYKGSRWSDLAEISDIPSDGDTSSSNELVTGLTADDTFLYVNQAGSDPKIPLSSLNEWDRDLKMVHLHKNDYDVAIGMDHIVSMDNLGFYTGDLPRLDICTGESESKGGFRHLLSLYHAKCGYTKELRRIGMNLSLRKDLDDKYYQDGGMFIESYEPYGADPSLKIYLSEYEVINIVPNKEIPWVGIHTDRPQCEFFVDGRAGGTTAWTQFSDSTLKEDVQTIDSALTIVQNMRGVYFNWKEDTVFTRPEGRQVGFIAQELQPFLPEVVNDTSEYSPYYTVSYSTITPVLAEAIKELKAQKDSEIEALRSEKDAEIESLQTEIDALRSLVESMQQTIEAIQNTSN